MAVKHTQTNMSEAEAMERLESILSAYRADDPARVSILSAFKIGKMVEHSQLEIPMGEAS